jgi:hypothetical protein
MSSTLKTEPGRLPPQIKLKQLRWPLAQKHLPTKAKGHRKSDLAGSLISGGLGKELCERIRHNCQAIMEQVVWIAPLASEPGLRGYECPKCTYATSALVHPERRDVRP